MQFAIDENGNRIGAYNAEPISKYRCPECKGTVIPKVKGDFRIPHFAHWGCECTDNWHYDMSDWHMRMQEYFDEEYREIVCDNGRSTHRADILKDGVVLEFQHSPISVDEFNDRNNFYISLGYKVVWVFDVEEQIDNEQLYFEKTNDSRIQMRWKYPLHVLKCCPKLSEYDHYFALFLHWPHDEDEEGEETIEKVIWSTKDDNGEQDLKRIIISSYYYSISKNMNLSELFVSRKDYLKERLENVKPYNIKKIGIKGFPKDSYVCPRRSNSFGLKAFSEIGCHYCKYCGALEETGRGEYGKNYNVYCCYPKQVNEETDPDLGLYESEAPIY